MASLSALAEAVLWKQVNTTDLLQTFQSVIVNTIQCNSCKRLTHQCDTPLVLSLAVPKSSDTQVSVSVESCLQDFFGGELVSDYRCSWCGAKGVTKSSLLARSPDTLVLQLKRYSVCVPQLHENAVATKNAQLVHFGPSLNLAKVLHSNKHDCDYTLYAVVNHVGSSTKAGHYTAHVLQPYLRCWFHFDDSLVTNATFEQVVTTNAYMLFFTRSTLLPPSTNPTLASPLGNQYSSTPQTAEPSNFLSTELLNFVPVRPERIAVDSIESNLAPEVWHKAAINAMKNAYSKVFKHS